MFMREKLRSIARRLAGRTVPLHGEFGDWNTACKQATGYHQPVILDRLIAAAEEAAASEGRKFDRDGVIFDTTITPFPLLAHVLMVIDRDVRPFHVVDFGGGLGSTYRQCRPFLRSVPALRWSVVEQSHVVAAGRSRLQTSELRFLDRLEDAAGDSIVHVVVFSGVLQYLDDPYAVLSQARGLKPRLILIDRTPLCERPSDCYSVQVVDDAIFPARLPVRIFGKGTLEGAVGSGYRKIGEFDAIDQEMSLGTMRVRFKGLAFEATDIN